MDTHDSTPVQRRVLKEFPTLHFIYFGERHKADHIDRTDPESPRVRDMIRKEYTEVLRLDDDLLGTDTCVYVRKV